MAEREIDAARQMARKKPDNPKRRFAYFVGMVQGWAGSHGRDEPGVEGP